MEIAISRPSQSQKQFLLIAGLLGLGAIVLSLVPSFGLGGHEHYLIYLLATHKISVGEFVYGVLTRLPFFFIALFGRGLIISALTWFATWLSSVGLEGIGIAIATLASSGVGAAIIGVLGAATLG